MHPAYDEQLESCWKDLLRQKKTSRKERFEQVVSKANTLFIGPDAVQKQPSSLLKTTKKTLTAPTCNQWKLQKVCVSCLPQKSYACVCSQPIDRFFLVQNDQGVVLRIGKECIQKVLSGTNLELARREMELAEIEEAEFRKQRDQERISINSRFDIDI